MSYQSATRRKMLELKSLMGLSYKDLSAQVGVHHTVLQQFGTQKQLLSEESEKTLNEWLTKNGGGYEFLECSKDLAQ